MVYKYNYFGDINNDFINALSKSIGALPKDAEGLFINISSWTQFAGGWVGRNDD